MRKTKIVCTLGPASSTPEVMEQMLRNGMNVARLNFSHGTHEGHKKMIETFRAVRDKLDVPAAVLLDTKGPEIRLGLFKGGKVDFATGSTVTLTTNEVEGTSEIAQISYKDLPRQVGPGKRILLDDGRLALEVVEVPNETDIVCKVVEGGWISDRKGVYVPYTHLDFEFLSEKDKEDLRFAIENDVDFIAASFVRSKDDVIQMRKYLDYYGGHDIKIIAKIENMEGVENFSEILRHADGIMVARGDMGVEIEYERLPGLQKRFIRECYQAGKMVITATQMLESMAQRTTPTRAEITDVANAVFDGTSAIMLSGETAMGAHPPLVVKVMAKIARQAEHDAFEMGIYKAAAFENDMEDITNAICDAACTTARDVHAEAIIAVTKSGYTARRVSKFRPIHKIVAATPMVKAYHQLALSWGVYPVLALYQQDANQLFRHAIDCALKYDLVKVGDNVVITAGVDGTTNSIKLAKVPGHKR